jgi:hypothetical protein
MNDFKKSKYNEDLLEIMDDIWKEAYALGRRDALEDVTEIMNKTVFKKESND